MEKLIIKDAENREMATADDARKILGLRGRGKDKVNF